MDCRIQPLFTKYLTSYKYLNTIRQYIPTDAFIFEKRTSASNHCTHSSFKNMVLQDSCKRGTLGNGCQESYKCDISLQYLTPNIKVWLRNVLKVIELCFSDACLIYGYVGVTLKKICFSGKADTWLMSWYIFLYRNKFVISYNQR